MTDLHPVTGAYVVDALDRSELADFEAHLVSCADCREEVDSFAPAVLALSATTLEAPPSALRESVLAGITRVRPLPPMVAEATAPAQAPASPEASPAAAPLQPPPLVAAAPPLPARASLARRLRGPLAAAAAVAVIVGGVAVWQRGSERQNQQQIVTAEDRVLQAPDAARERLTFPGGAAATLVRSVSLKQAVLITEAMPPAPEGKVYQVWFDVPGQGMVRAALMPPKSDQVVILDGDAAQATGAGITVEPVGGSAEPTSDPIALFDFTKLETT